mmetsp:Transcript_111461/g.296195  ORF Transcript_111461/g.296195 Transcript_111461/m.296195 type:complete len:261 (-) Transcript_111461:14-796(-)
MKPMKAPYGRTSSTTPRTVVPTGTNATRASSQVSARGPPSSNVAVEYEVASEVTSSLIRLPGENGLLPSSNRGGCCPSCNSGRGWSAGAGRKSMGGGTGGVVTRRVSTAGDCGTSEAGPRGGTCNGGSGGNFGIAKGSGMWGLLPSPSWAPPALARQVVEGRAHGPLRITCQRNGGWPRTQANEGSAVGATRATATASARAGRACLMASLARTRRCPALRCPGCQAELAGISAPCSPHAMWDGARCPGGASTLAARREQP